MEAPLVFSDDENNNDDEEFKEESRRNAKYGIPVGREEEEEPRPGQFLSRSLENQSPFSGILEKIRLSRKLFHVSTSRNKLASKRVGPVEGWLVVHRVTVSTRNKNNSVPGREIKKKKKKERKMSGRKRKSGKLPKLPKPLDNGEDIFSNEPRRVHSSANYTSTTFSVFLLFYS